MENTSKIQLTKENIKPKDKVKENDLDILTELKDITTHLRLISQHYNFADDEDLIESCIYEMNALAARYRYLIKLAKQQNLTAENKTKISIIEGVFPKLG